MNLLNKINNFFNIKKISVTFLNEDWSVYNTNKILKSVPNKGDLVYDENYNGYFEIMLIIHYLNNSNIFIVIKPILKDEIK